MRIAVDTHQAGNLFAYEAKHFKEFEKLVLSLYIYVQTTYMKCNCKQ
jgi:hypothetical protein